MTDLAQTGVTPEMLEAGLAVINRAFPGVEIGQAQVVTVMADGQVTAEAIVIEIWQAMRDEQHVTRAVQQLAEVIPVTAETELRIWHLPMPEKPEVVIFSTLPSSQAGEVARMVATAMQKVTQ